MYKLQIKVMRPGYDWEDLCEPSLEQEVDKLLEYHRWLDSKPPIATHYHYRKIKI